MRRRELLKTGLGLGVWSLARPALGWNLLNSSSLEQKFLVMVELNGGWDVTLGLDPWTLPQRPLESDMFVEYRDDEVIRTGALAFGPAARALLPHSKDFSVVNGVVVSRRDQGHGGSRDYMISGGTGSRNAAFVLEAFHAGSNGPYGVLSDSDFQTGRRPLVKSGVSIIGQQAQNVDFSEIFEKLVVVGTDSDLLDAQRRILASRTEVQGMNRFLKNILDQGRELKDQDIVAAALLNDISQQALLVKFANLDTHADHPVNHMTEQKLGMEYVAELFSYFKSLEWKDTGRSLFDQTVFVVTSEFSRTPYLNASKGKDHNPLTNSVLIAGGGIRGGVTLGQSQLVPKAQSRIGSAYHMGCPIDLSTGRIANEREGSGFIFPENVLMTAALALGLDVSKIESFDPATRSLPWLMK